MEQDGIHQLTYAKLSQAGLPLAEIDPRSFKIHHKDQQIPIFVQGQDNGKFELGEFILFFGQELKTKYTNQNIYWLTWGEGDGARMTDLDGTPSGGGTTPSRFLTTKHLEVDYAYRSNYTSGPEDDHWYWKTIPWYNNLPDPENFAVTFELSNLSTEPISATIRGRLRSYFPSYDQHHSRVYLNDNPVPVDDAIWDKGTDYFFEKPFAQSDLNEGINTITTNVPYTSTYVLLNWYEIDYYHTYKADDDILWFDGDQAGFYKYQIG